MNKGFSAKVNELEFTTEVLSEEVDIVRDGDGHFHLLENGKAYRAEVIHANEIDKSYKIKVNGTTFDVQLKDHYDRLVDQMGLSALSNQKANDVKAPMPGLVLEVIAKEGDTVAKGDAVLILEAMKMENVLKAPGDGTIASIEVEQGTAVDKGQLLIKID